MNEDRPPTDSQRQKAERRYFVEKISRPPGELNEPQQEILVTSLSGTLTSWLTLGKELLKRLIGRFLNRSAAEHHVVERGYFETLSLGKWGFFLLAKLALFWSGLIAFHPFENLCFAAFVIFSVSSRFWRYAYNFVSLLLAIVLLYYDSWLPSVSRLIEAMPSISGFGWDYLFQLLIRSINVTLVAGMMAAAIVYRMIWRKCRIGVLVVLVMLGEAFLQSPIWMEVKHEVKGVEVAQSPRDMDSMLQSFFDRESQRIVVFPSPKPGDVPFDLVFIHVCSLSWDDIQAVGLEDHPLWQQFDILFKKFNSAASYSGPSIIHMLRANCGQQEHRKMYIPAPAGCYLLDNLKDIGYETDFALNHRGSYDDLLSQIYQHGHVSSPLMSQDGLDVALHAFYSDSRHPSPIYSDQSVLDRWLKKRKESVSSRVVFFYNTATLHDGNYYPGGEALPDTLRTYRQRLSLFLDEMDAFMQKLSESGRPTVLVMVPEHGAAVKGDKRQIVGLREIPTPSITQVPVGIKVIGATRQGGAALNDQSTSYLAVAHVVARMLEHSPFVGGHFLASDYVAGLPVTDLVSQNQSTTVAKFGDQYYISRGTGSWDSYTEFNKLPARQ